VFLAAIILTLLKFFAVLLREIRADAFWRQKNFVIKIWAITSLPSIREHLPFKIFYRFACQGDIDALGGGKKF
jgi:hypothetical protein